MKVYCENQTLNPKQFPKRMFCLAFVFVVISLRHFGKNLHTVRYKFSSCDKNNFQNATEGHHPDSQDSKYD